MSHAAADSFWEPGDRVRDLPRPGAIPSDLYFPGDRASGGSAHNADDFADAVRARLASQCFATVADLRAYDRVLTAISSTTLGYFRAGDGGMNVFCYDPADTTTADNAGSVIVDRRGRRWKQVDATSHNVLAWGAKYDGLEATATANRVAIQAALTVIGAMGMGRLWFPSAVRTMYIAVPHLDLAANAKRVTIQIDGILKRPASSIWTGHFLSMFHFARGGYEKLRFTGSGILEGNALNQTPGVSGNYGKENAIRVDGGADVLVENITIRGFGGFALLCKTVNTACARGLTIDQTLGSHDPVYGKNADGVHFYTCNRVRVSDCDIASTDDCIACTTDINHSVSGGIVITGNTLRPTATSVTHPPSGVRISAEIGVVGSQINDVLIDSNQIHCRAAAAGILLGGVGAFVIGEHNHRRVQIANNVIHGSNGYEPISVGPASGRLINANQMYSSVTICNATDVTLADNQLVNQRGRGMIVRNCGLVRIASGCVKNVQAETDGSLNTVAGLTIDLTNGNITRVEISGGFRVEDSVGAGIRCQPGSYTLTELVVSGARVRGFNTSAAAGSNGRAGLYVQGVTKALIERFSAEDGNAYGCFIVPDAGGHYRVSACEFRNNNTADAVGSVGHLWCGPANASSAVAGQFIVSGCLFGEFNSRMVVFQNCYAWLLDNKFISPGTTGTPVSEAVMFYYGAGPATFAMHGNIFDIAQSNAQPTSNARLYNVSGQPVIYHCSDNQMVNNLPFTDAASHTVRNGVRGTGEMTTMQRDAMGVAPNGMCIYNTTVHKYQVRAGGVWVNLH
jgi:hypothetical protein